MIDSPSTSRSPSPCRPDHLSVASLLPIFAFAVVVRAAWGLFRLSQAHDSFALEFPDEQQYWLLAKSLAGGEGLKDELGFRAGRMPLYPAFLALFTGMANGVVWAKAAHWVLGGLTAVLAALLGAAMAGRKAGAIAGVIVAVDPFLIFFSSLLLTETPFIAALLFFLLLLWRTLTRTAPTWHWVVVGLAGAWCVYLRESSAGLVALLLISAIFTKRFDARTVIGATVAAAFVLGALIPWAARNRQVTGEWVFLTTRGGISLYDGVGPQATGASDLGAIKQSPAVRGMSEIEWDRHFRELAYRAMRENPGRVLRLAAIKVRRTWNPAANAAGYSAGTFSMVGAAWSLSIYILATAGALVLICRRGGVDRVWYAVFILSAPTIYLTVLHAVFVGSVRYRLPAMPLLAILAAVAIWGGMTLLRSRSPQRQQS